MTRQRQRRTRNIQKYDARRRETQLRVEERKAGRRGERLEQSLVGGRQSQGRHQQANNRKQRLEEAQNHRGQDSQPSRNERPRRVKAEEEVRATKEVQLRRGSRANRD